MNTNQLKKFAQNARRKLMELVAAKIDYVLDSDSAELREKKQQIQQLAEQLRSRSKKEIAEQVAYIWFNRLMALRFMDANDYTEAKVISPLEGQTEPEILQLAKAGDIDEDLPVDRQKILDLLDGKIPAADPHNEALRLLIVGVCNYYHRIMPFMFQRIEDYTELLMPDDVLSQQSIVAMIRKGMSVEDCQEVEIIGWLYQFYISERKDEVFAAKGKVAKEDIPAATQLFTPRWIVEYMVQNTLGKLWLQNRPDSNLREHMPYFIESPSIESSDYLKINSVEEITLLDQACGSGHILSYAFDLFTKIYEEEGYKSSEISQLIIEKNLSGFEIDERAAQLAGMTLMMKARGYYRRAFRKNNQPNILQYQDLRLSEEDITSIFQQIDQPLSQELAHDFSNMRQATNLGSLIIPHTPLSELAQVMKKVNDSAETMDIFLKPQLKALQTTLLQLVRLARKYHCVVDNPPYMGGGKMNKNLSAWVKVNYPKSKADLMVCFMERAESQLFENGLLGMINLPSWMFLSSFKDYRKELINFYQIETLLHLGRGIFGSDFGTVAFTFRKTKGFKSQGVYRRLFDKHVQVRSVEKIRKLFLNKDFGYYNANQLVFKQIPGTSIAYWLSNGYLNAFNNFTPLSKISDTRKGLATSNNNRFLRLWTEIQLGKSSILQVENAKKKWYPYNKGGAKRKWYGNNEFVINWESNGYEIKNFRDDKGKLRSRPQNLEYSFKQAITWSKITSGGFSARICYGGFLFDDAAAICHSRDLELLLKINAFLNSSVAQNLLNIINPTLNIQIGDIGNLPVSTKGKVDELMYNECIKIAKKDWNSRETSWDFQKNELLHLKALTLKESYQNYQEHWQTQFHQLHKNEEELNRQFIETYGLAEELTPDVPLEDITILKAETTIENGGLKFKADEVMRQLVSYGVGCMFGRYSLDKDGLILANQGETLADYLEKVDRTTEELAFLPDDDNIIPILEDEWFEDDIVGRFQAFIKASFGEENYTQNIAFLENCLGKDLRKYFIKDFYTDHIKRYKKRPIYWLFSSAQGAFNVLVYLHRYTPDTLNNILNNYLKPFQEKLKARIQHLEQVEISGTAGEKTRALKERERYQKVLLELKVYEREVLYPLATERIALDLDDGVLVNYNKLGEAIKLVKGLNDGKAKGKVRGFDWIEVSEIR